jgi:hypothetical protein
MRGFFLCLILGMFFLIQGTAALVQPDALPLPTQTAEATFSSTEVADLNPNPLDTIDKRLQKRDGTSDAKLWKDIVNLLAGYVGGKLDTFFIPGPCKELFAQNFLAEIENAVCEKAGGDAINALIGADLATACTRAFIAGAVLEPPAELIALFTAGVACNFMVSWFFSHTPVLSDLTKFVDYICSQPKPCGDLLSDPKNCGCCGNVVRICNINPTQSFLPLQTLTSNSIVLNGNLQQRRLHEQYLHGRNM